MSLSSRQFVQLSLNSSEFVIETELNVTTFKSVYIWSQSLLCGHYDELIVI